MSLFNQNNLKRMLKKGVQIGALGAILGAGTLMTGCPLTTGPGTIDPIEIEDPKYSSYKPYDKALGNGNYVAHNFLGDYDFGLHDDFIPSERLEKDGNHYLGLGKTYIENQVKDFQKSLKGRPGAQEYFSSINDISQAGQYMQIGDDADPKGFNIDYAGNKIVDSTRDYFVDIINNLDNNVDRNTFTICYKALTAESYYVGQGKEMFNRMDNRLKSIENLSEDWRRYNTSHAFNIEQDVQENNCLEITETIDNLLGKVVKNINEKQGLDLTLSDYQRVVNFSVLANSLGGIDDTINTTLHSKHPQLCQSHNYIVQTMKDLTGELYRRERDANQGLSR